jgi:hypothetical protein
MQDPESQGDAPLIAKTTHKNANVVLCSLEAPLEPPTQAKGGVLLP